MEYFYSVVLQLLTFTLSKESEVILSVMQIETLLCLKKKNFLTATSSCVLMHERIDACILSLRMF